MTYQPPTRPCVVCGGRLPPERVVYCPACTSHAIRRVAIEALARAATETTETEVAA